MRTLAPVVAFFAVLSFGGHALADGVLLRTSDLPAADRKTLAASIAAAKARIPEAFEAVRAVDTYKANGARRLRAKDPSATRAFRRIGPGALWPLIELAAFKADRSALSPAEWNALGAGILEALAVLEREEARPVFAAVVELGGNAEWADRAAEGLGMLCGAEDQTLLLSQVGSPGARGLSAIVGLQHCRTTEVTERMADVLAGATDAERGERAARALGFLGSTWALAAEKHLSPGDKESIRALANRSLRKALEHPSEAVRVRAGKALRMTELASSKPAISGQTADR